MQKIRLFCLSVLALVSMPSINAAAPPIFTQTYGYTNQNNIELRGFNNSGDLLIQINYSAPALVRAGVVQELIPTGQSNITFIQAYGLSDRRDDGNVFVVGTAQMTDGYWRAAIWDVAANGGFTFKIAPNIVLPEDSSAPGEQPRASAAAVNKAGVVVGGGVSYLAGVAVRWEPPYTTAQRFILSTGSSFVDIEEDGSMLADGIEYDHGGEFDRYAGGIILAGGGIIEVPLLEKTSGALFPNFMKKRAGNWVVGNAKVGNTSRAFAWNVGSSSSINLPNLAEYPNTENTDGLSINSSGIAVGRLNGGSGSGAAVLWLNSNGAFTAYRFGSLLPAEQYFNYPADDMMINDAGQVAFQGRDFSGAFVRIFSPVSDGIVQFVTESGFGSEDDGRMEFAVKLTRAPGASGAVTLSYETADGTATAPANYVSTKSSITWNPGESGEKKIFIPLVNNNVFDEDKSFRLKLTGISGAQLAATTEALAYIYEPFPQVNTRNQVQTETFLYGVAAVRGQGQVTLLLERTGGTDGQLTVTNFTAFDATAMRGTDYQLPANLSITWGRGEGGVKSISVPLFSTNVPITEAKWFSVNAETKLEGASFGGYYSTSVLILPSTNKTAPLIATDVSKSAGKLNFSVEAVQGTTVELLKGPDLSGPFLPIAEARVDSGEVSFSPAIETSGSGYFRVRVKQ